MDEQNELYQVLEQQTQALVSLQTDNNNLQQQLQDQQQEVSNLKQELAQAYKRMQSLTTSDLQLKEAQQLKQSASADLENSRQLLTKQKSLQQLNEQSKRDLESSRKTLENQQKELEERENRLETTLGAYKKQAEDDAAAALANGWQKLNEAQDAAEKEQDDERQRIEDLKAEAQRELAEAQKAKADAAEKGYHDTVSTYRLAIYAMMLFCVILGLVEVYKHKYIFGVYVDWYTSLSSYIGFLPAFGVAAIAAAIFFVVYFVPLRDSDGLYLGLTMRLILLVTLFALADAVTANTAAIIIYLSCIVVGWFRWEVFVK